MPAAIDRATYLVFSAATGGMSTIIADDLQQEIHISSESVMRKTQGNLDGNRGIALLIGQRNP